MKWISIAAVVGVIGFGLSQMSSVAYTDRDIDEVDFSGLSRGQKQTALEAANEAGCTCGCGLTVAKCVVTDETCPLREDNIKRIRRMVDDARSAS